MRERWARCELARERQRFSLKLVGGDQPVEEAPSLTFLRCHRAAGVEELGRASLADVRSLDLRSPTRDLWADESALWDRLLSTWAGLDEAAWHLPGAAPSDAGGPDWSLAEHVGHLADWQELAIDYVGVAIQTGRWPSDDDYDGGDFDRYNERRRAPWTTMSSAAILARLQASRPSLLEIAETPVANVSAV